MTTTLGLFSTPFYRTAAGFGNHLDELTQCLLAKESAEFANPSRPQTAHSSLFESRFDLFTWPHKPIQQLKQHVYSHLMNYLAEVSSFDQQALDALKFNSESWFHITRSGGYFQPHNHPLASISLIYCVCPGSSDEPDSRSQGFVQFFDPRGSVSMYLDAANRFMSRQYSFNSTRFKLQADELCIFPSYLQHCVEPYIGSKPRITIAANFSFHLKHAL